MKKMCDVAIIGAGPYGLSLAAHLRARGMDFRVIGKPLDSWRSHMPEDMILKSDGFASNLSAPAPDATLKAWCKTHGKPYADQGLPVPLKQFLDYAAWFRARFVPDLEDTTVTRLERDGDRFALTLATGERFHAARVVLAVGITHYAFTPDELAPLTGDLLSHSYDHHTFERFAGKDVAVIGAGASAVNSAYDLRLVGAIPHIITRRANVDYNSIPDPDAETFIRRTVAPASGIGRGWKSYFCAAAPLLFHRLPRHLKDRAIDSHKHAAGGWFMRDKVEGHVAQTCSRIIAGSAVKNGRAELTLAAADGKTETLRFDHVIAATGYQPDLRKLLFLASDLAERAAPGGGSPEVSDNFETAVPGLYAAGLTAMASFGPLMRFMCGAAFAAPRLASHLNRITVETTRKAA